jgi:hypothetical protein
MRATSLSIAFAVACGLASTSLPLAAQPAQIAQAPGARDDLLDRLVRRMMICAEVSDSQRRLQCYDQLQASSFTGAGSPPPPAAAGPPPATIGGIIGNLPPSDPPPGREQVVRGGECTDNPVNCAYDPRRQQLGVVTGGGTREVRRQQGPLPARDPRQPLVTIRVEGLRDIEQRWVLTLAVTSAAQRVINPAVACMLRNGSQQVTELTYTAAAVKPGETVVLDMIGPAVTAAYVDSGLCRVVSPLQ